MRGDEYTKHFVEGKPETMKGKIVSVNRHAKAAQGPTCYSVVLEDDKIGRRTILLAPVAYMNGQKSLPGEDATVTITAVRALDAEGDSVWVARTVEHDGNTMRLRNDATTRASRRGRSTAATRPAATPRSRAISTTGRFTPAARSSAT
jgi:hypothetical protein